MSTVSRGMSCTQLKPVKMARFPDGDFNNLHVVAGGVFYSSALIYSPILMLLDL